VIRPEDQVLADDQDEVASVTTIRDGKVVATQDYASSSKPWVEGSLVLATPWAT
jgi:hypothetical protein